MTNPLEGLITQDDIADVAESEFLILDDKRISVLEAMRSIDVQACPGSGKTTLIAAKLILLAKKWRFHHQGICVLSHTNVAKDEIIGRLKRSKTTEAQRLLKYPHFIGTIQEFVGKYVAFPFIRSDGSSINRVDTDICVDLIYSKLPVGTRAYVDRKNQYSNVLYDFDLDYTGGGIHINVPTFPNGSNSKSYKDLLSVRKNLIEDGYFFYRDIFSFAMMALKENEALPLALRNRFQCVFLDEMQDTQKYQDELLCEIFPLDDDTLIVQRFGDPDQAIFHGVGSEEPNQSYNGKSRDEMDFVIHKSHRFDGMLADKIKSLSFNEIPLETELSAETLADRAKVHVTGGGFKHTIIVFDDNTRGIVVETFAQIVSNQFTEEYKKSHKFITKVVGAVGNEIDPNADQLKIGHYWPDYDKSKAKTDYKETCLIEAVRYCHQSSSIDCREKYKFLIDCILRFVRMAGKLDQNGRFFSYSTLRDSLKADGHWETFRKRVYSMLNDANSTDQQFWEDICNSLTLVFELDSIPTEAVKYISFSEEITPTGIMGAEDQETALLASLKDNKVTHSDGFRIELSTIHGVKGETHDATLIVETKNHTFDLETMMGYLTEELPNADHPNSKLPDKPNSRRVFKPNKFFMKQFFVAMSRPKHLLCLAIHSDRISDEQKRSLQERGWHVEVLDPNAKGMA